MEQPSRRAVHVKQGTGRRATVRRAHHGRPRGAHAAHAADTTATTYIAVDAETGDAETAAARRPRARRTLAATLAVVGALLLMTPLLAAAATDAPAAATVAAAAPDGQGWFDGFFTMVEQAWAGVAFDVSGVVDDVSAQLQTELDRMARRAAHVRSLLP